MGDHFAFLFPIMFVTLGCAFLVTWRWGAAAALPWGIGFASAGIASTMPILPSAVPDTVCAITADSLFGLSFFCYGHALLRRAGGPMLVGARLAILALSIGLCVAAKLSGSLRGELAASDTGCGLLIGIALVPMLRRLRQPIDRILFGVTILVTLDNLLRASTVFLTAPAGSGGYLASSYAFIMQSSAVILGLVLALVALAAIALDVAPGQGTEPSTDALTGLLTRSGLEKALSARRPAALSRFIACDVDRLQKADEIFGHGTSDRVLMAIAGLIGALAPAGALAARIGDAFLIYVPEGDASALAGRIQAAIVGHDWHRGGVVGSSIARIGLSAVIGIECRVREQPAISPSFR